MRNRFRLVPALVVACVMAALPAEVLAQVAYLSTNLNRLLRIDLSAPGTVTRQLDISGVGSEIVVAIDYRPANGQLYALTSGNRLYAINTANGVATAVGNAGAFTLAGTGFGFDVNPVVDRIRVVTDTDQNLRLNPNDGTLTATDTVLSYAAGDVNAGANPAIAGSAYTNSTPGAATTTLFGIDTGLNVLVTQNPPNSGTLNTVGPLGVDAELVPGFDIRSVGGSNAGFAVMRVNGVYGLYSINLVTGAATLVGNLPAGVTFTGLAIAPVGRPAMDVNGDGRSDIVFRNATNGQVHRMLMNGFAITFSATVYAEPNLSWKIVGDGDFDGNGTSDLLWRNGTTGDVYFMPFTTDGVPAPAGGGIVHTEPNASWEIVATPDINGDGRADLLWQNSSTGDVYAMLLNGAAIIGQGPVHREPNLAWSIVTVMSGAGEARRNQLVWQNSLSGEVYLMTVNWNGTAFTQTGRTLYKEPNDAWRIVGTPDLDGDGASELLVRNVATGDVVALFVNSFGGVSTATVHREANLAWKIVATGDYNGDGKSDILWRNESTGHLHMMLMNSFAIASQATFYAEPNTAWKVMGPYEYGVQ